MAPVAAAAANGRAHGQSSERGLLRVAALFARGVNRFQGCARARDICAWRIPIHDQPDVYIFMRLPPVIGSINAIIRHARPLPVLIIFTV
jgi:hypothetical protein